MANAIETFKKYIDNLDEVYKLASTTSKLDGDTTLVQMGANANEIVIPKISMDGLADYDRNGGYKDGSVNLTNETVKFNYDRGRKFAVDAMDNEETAGLAFGKLSSEFIRTKVVPECDAYVLSKLAGLAVSRSNTVDGDETKPFETLIQLINEVQSVAGYDEELVAFVDNYMFAALQNSPEISRMISVTDFKQGDVNIKVKSINGVAIIPVVSERMKTAYTFNAAGAGGFIPGENAREIYMMVCPKKGAHLVKKTENMRIFTPEQNLDADAYKFDYRVYYDVFVNKSGLDAIWAWVSPEATITYHPNDVEVTSGAIEGILEIAAESEASLTYQWYSCSSDNGSYPVKLAGENRETFVIPTDLEDGKHYFFAKVIIDGKSSLNSAVATVTVK